MAVFRWIALASVVLVCSILVRRLLAPTDCNSSDTAWFSSVAPSNDSSYKLQSFYVSVRDGTRIAVDVYLPSWWTAGDAGLPTILHLTRYNRAYKVRWPFSLLLGKQLNVRSARYVETFISRGYALVTADVRGTGASFGHRPFEFYKNEIHDYPDVLEWVLKQKWCNGKVGTGGISYDGMTGLYLAAQAEGKVQAVAYLFAPGDILEELSGPGGVACTGFARDYLSLVVSFEHNLPFNVWLPWKMWFFANFVVSGSAPVSGYEIDHIEAIKDHKKNWNAMHVVSKVQFRDEVITSIDGQDYTPDDLNVRRAVAEKLVQNNVAVYSFGGYFDSASVRSAAALHQLLEKDGKSKLTIGPWTHGGRQNSSPFSASTRVCFDLQSDIARFFDFHLKNNKSGIEVEDPVHYFTMGKEEWKAITHWPPSYIKYKTLFFISNFQLSETNGLKEAVDEYDVDYSTTTGVISRWNIVRHLFLQSVAYPNRAEQGTRTLSYTSDQLTIPLTISGTVTVRIHVESVKSRDLIIFAYLEDVDIDNATVTYVSEGVVRASHRCLNKSQSEVCERSYNKADWIPMDGIEKVDVHLEPVSYQFGVGHSVRVSLAGADTDNFDHDTGRFGMPLPKQWHLYREGSYDSKVLLPVEG
jgi:putative CocE/NonD family hydrolase